MTAMGIAKNCGHAMNYWGGHTEMWVHFHSMSDRPEYGNYVLVIVYPATYWTYFLVHFQ